MLENIIETRDGESKFVSLVRLWLFISVVSLTLYWLLWLTLDIATASKSDYDLWALLIDFAFCATNSLFSMAVVIFTQRVFGKRMENSLAFSFCLALSLLFSMAFALAVEEISERLIWIPVSATESFLEKSICCIVVSFVTLVTFLRMQHRLYVAEAERRKQLERAMLRQQLDPHFLFNSLSFVTALVDEDGERAKHYIAELSQIYRYILRNRDNESVPLSEAMPFVERYCSLIDSRSPGHFVFHFDKNLYDERMAIPVASLQMLVENAVKHNCHSPRQPLHISLTREDGYAVVRNTNQPTASADNSPHMGLDNLNRRSLLFCNRPLVVEQTSDSFSVKIPVRPYESTHH